MSPTARDGLGRPLRQQPSMAELILWLILLINIAMGYIVGWQARVIDQQKEQIRQLWSDVQGCK